MVVGAIDFGTTYSGWGYSLSADFESGSDPSKYTVKLWQSGSIPATEKTPSCVLIGPDKNFLAFGYEAENMYQDLAENGDPKSHYYFRRFKMVLNKKIGEKIHGDITVQDEMGKCLPAVLVFSMAIKYLVNDMVADVNTRLTSDLNSDVIRWVITVPAIWTNAAKQFMRKAANKAGIDDQMLTIALEPEVASLYCRHLSVETTVDRQDVSIAKLKVGTRYMILDAGGGTIDITVHEVTGNGKVKEVDSASGGGWGGILVDKAFEDLVIDIFTKDIYDQFKMNETEDWLHMWRDFEVMKRTITPTYSSPISLVFPVSLIDRLSGQRTSVLNRSIDMAQIIANSKYAGKISVKRDKFRFESELIRCLFDESIAKTVGHVGSILSEVDVNSILMVGGFSESAMLQHAIKHFFSSKVDNIVIPLGASSTILRGAIIFGHSPKSITERVLQYTYGVATTDPFQEGVHPEKHRIVTDRGLQCNNIFDKHAERNQTVTVGEPHVKRIYTPINKFQTSIGLPIYASTLANPKYVDEGCSKIGMFKVYIADPDDDLDRKFEVCFTFSGTEIDVEARDMKSGTKCSTTIDFLG